MLTFPKAPNGSDIGVMQTGLQMLFPRPAMDEKMIKSLPQKMYVLQWLLNQNKDRSEKD